MQVAELATDLGVSSKVLLNLLRSMRISASDEAASISEGDAALILARLERERRSGHKDAAEAETAQGSAVEGGEESISLALSLNPICKL